jgi:hypothetical protein
VVVVIISDSPWRLITGHDIDHSSGRELQDNYAEIARGECSNKV